MVGFLASGWLIGLAALAVPVAIHLFSRKEARRIRVGSIARMEATAPTRVRRLALTDVPRLALRMGILGVLAVLLAGPVWRPTGGGGERWLLAADDASDPTARAVIDSLERRGYRRQAAPATDYWGALARLDRRLPPGSRIAVVAPARLAGLSGRRPRVASSVEWFDVGGTSSSEWVADARRLAGDSVRMTWATSDDEITRFRRETVAAPAVATRPARGDTIAVILFDEAHAADAGYVRAALRTAAAFAGIEVAVRTVPAAEGVAPGRRASWIFWLSPSAPTAEVRDAVAAGAILVEDAGTGEYDRVDTRLLGTALPADAAVGMTRRVAAPPGVPVWWDGGGVPVLTVEPAGKGVRYRFASRFHPAWTALVEHPAFPHAVVALASGPRRWHHGSAPYAVDAEDRRRLSARQVQPALDRAVERPRAQRRIPLDLPVWLVLALLFGAERWVASVRGRAR